MPLSNIPQPSNTNDDLNGTITGEFLQNGAGARDQVDDWSAAEESFFIAPAVDQILVFNRIVFNIVTSSNNPRADAYAGGATGVVLANGIILRTADGAGNTIEDFTDTLPIQSNVDWAKFCYDTMETVPSAGPSFITTRWSWFKHGKPIVLDGRLANIPIFEMVLHDDFTAVALNLTEQTAYCGGYTIP